jgi:hypothetical protein
MKRHLLGAVCALALLLSVSVSLAPLPARATVPEPTTPVTGNST